MNEKLNLRCPHCQKLYEVETRSIKSSSPYFECLVCSEVFSFQFPPNNLDSIKTFSVQNPRLGDQELKKICPKCGTANHEDFHECFSCQIVFEKYELIKNETHPGARPHLVALWKKYVEDYESPTLLEDFLEACFQARDLDYAQKKIKDLLLVVGPDLFCEQALHRVEVYRTQVKTLDVGPDHSLHIKQYAWYFDRIWDLVSQKKFLMWAPITGILFLLFCKWVGFYQGNIVGPAVSILLLHFGLIFFAFGRIQISDFFDKK
jgi:hypothetical protein